MFNINGVFFNQEIWNIWDNGEVLKALKTLWLEFQFQVDNLTQV